MNYYWINISSYEDRKKFMEQQFKHLKITTHTRIEAVKPDNVDKVSHDDDKPYICDPSQKHFPNCKNCLYERCTLSSHMKAIQKGYDDGHSWFMILEDDTCMPMEIDFDKLLKYSPDNAECLQLFCSMPLTVKKLYNLYEQKQLWIRWRMIIPSASGYLISRKGAKKIIDNFVKDGKYCFNHNNSCRLADVMIYENLNTYTHTFPLFYPNIDLGSILHPEHLKSHELGRDVIRHIINTNSSHPFAKKYVL